MVALAALTVEAEGKRFLHRTAAGWLRARAGIAPLPPLRGADLPQREGPVLIVAGSYVGKTSEQLNALLAPGDLTHFQLPIAPLLDERRAEFIEAARRALADTLNAGHDAALFTAREHVAGTDSASGLAIGRAVSTALIAIVQGVAATANPGYLIAKGGITSHDLAAEGLGRGASPSSASCSPASPSGRWGRKRACPACPTSSSPATSAAPAHSARR